MNTLILALRYYKSHLAATINLKGQQKGEEEMVLRALLIAALATATLASCSSKTNEIKLLSEDNSHMFYIYPDDLSAELYTGMSLVNNYKLVAVTEDSYELTTNDSSKNLKLTLNPNTTTWLCTTCKRLGLATKWNMQ